jgi:long-chain acyl-CoA synthetase
MILSRPWRCAALVAALLTLSAVHAAEVAGIKVDDKLRVGNSELLLNGAGLRSKLFIKVYVGALYAGQKVSSAAAIIDSPQMRRMSLRLMRDIDSDSLYAALDDGLKNNHTPTELAAMKASTDKLGEIMKAIGKGREGDTITLDFVADEVIVGVNGEARGKVVGAGFPKALLKVWIGEQPVDASLKKALLGG